VLGPSAVSETAIATAQAQSLGSTGSSGWTVVATLTTAGAVEWNDIAQQSFHQYVAFDLDGAVLAAPLIQPSNPTFASFDGKMEFGTFSEADAKSLAAVLVSGPLPVALTLQSLSTVSPVLGTGPAGSGPIGST
jgi:preprotein translocase subunit SecD